MGTYESWVVVIMTVGSIAAVAASALFWLMLTRPLAAAALFGGGL